MSRFTERLLGALLVLGFCAGSPVMAQSNPSNLSEAKFSITRVASQDFDGQFLIFTNVDNSSGCISGGWRNALMVPRSLKNFNEIVSLATAAMLAGKQILVWTGREFWNSPCGDAWGGATNSTDGIARISRLDVIN
jgi:hypothetical protein